MSAALPPVDGPDSSRNKALEMAQAFMDNPERTSKPSWGGEKITASVNYNGEQINIELFLSNKELARLDSGQLDTRIFKTAAKVAAVFIMTKEADPQANLVKVKDHSFHVFNNNNRLATKQISTKTETEYSELLAYVPNKREAFDTFVSKLQDSHGLLAIFKEIGKDYVAAMVEHGNRHNHLQGRFEGADTTHTDTHYYDFGTDSRDPHDPLARDYHH